MNKPRSITSICFLKRNRILIGRTQTYARQYMILCVFGWIRCVLFTRKNLVFDSEAFMCARELIEAVRKGIDGFRVNIPLLGDDATANSLTITPKILLDGCHQLSFKAARASRRTDRRTGVVPPAARRLRREWVRLESAFSLRHRS